MRKHQTIYLVDGSAYIYRAYHAIRELHNSKGLPTNAVFGFTRMLSKLLNERQPEYIAIFFDAKGPTFRHQRYPLYKANRPPMPEELQLQIPYIREAVRGFNLPVYEMPGFEADDVIGSLAGQFEKAGFSVVMVTGDKDFLQLITDNIRIWDPMKDVEYNTQSVQDLHGLPPIRIVDMMGLMGDSADNVPGVPGIGPKTAASLIQTFGSMENLYRQLDAVKQKKLSENLRLYKEQAFLSRELVTIKTDLSIPMEPDAFKYRAPDHERLYALYKELEFRDLMQSSAPRSDLSNKRYQTVFSLNELQALIQRLEQARVFALDTETTSLNPFRAELVGISVSHQEHEAFYIPCGHSYIGAPDQLCREDVLALLKPILENPGLEKIGQNIKFDAMIFHRYGIHLQGIAFDTMLASYLLNPSRRSHSLDQIAMEYLNHRTIAYEDITGKGKKQICFSEVPLEIAAPYACEDADITLMAFHVFQPLLEQAGLMSLFHHVEMPLLSVLMQMELIGVCVDRDLLADLSKAFEQQLHQLEDEIFRSAGERFNIQSSKQLETILFEKLNLPVQKKTRKKTGYSTDVDVLVSLSGFHELPALVLRHRTLSKLKSTYTDALQELIEPETGRIHTSYNQTVTATGRLSSSDPNLQNIPVRDEEGRQIRRAFVPRMGWKMISADYSQIELRILAHCSTDETLLDAFRKEEDVHSRTASEVFRVPLSAVTSEMRRQAKAINFGIIYGMSPFGLAKALNISQKMAKNYIDSYFARYGMVLRFIEETIQKAGETGQCQTLLGRIRKIPDINNPNHVLRQFAERTAVNTTIQGTAADLIKLAMIHVHDRLLENRMNTRMLLTVHDELVFEAPAEELEGASVLITQTMETAWALNAPLKVNIAFGDNWAEAH